MKLIATVVGNYPKIPNPPREATLRRAFHQLDSGRITDEELARVMDAVTLEVIQEQVQAGLDLITDGQIRWEDPQTYFAANLQGFTIDGLIRYFNTNVYYRQPVLQATPRWTAPITVRDFEFAQHHSPVPVKPVLTGPYTLARLSLLQNGGDLTSAVLALAEALNQEARALEAAGAAWIQVDEPALVWNKQDLGLFTRAWPRLVAGLKAPTALYLYFGDAVDLLPAVLELPVTLLALDFVEGPRNWELLKEVRWTKGLGLGIVDARNTKLEKPEETAALIHRALDLAQPTELHVHPSCGLEFLPREEACAKLVTLTRGVRLAEGGTA